MCDTLLILGNLGCFSPQGVLLIDFDQNETDLIDLESFLASSVYFLLIFEL